jgi:malonyl-CoA O-methyltransferase
MPPARAQGAAATAPVCWCKSCDAALAEALPIPLPADLALRRQSPTRVRLRVGAGWPIGPHRLNILPAMAAPEHDNSTSRQLDPVALRRCLQRLQSAEEAPWLHAEVARRMAGRLAILKHQPEVYIDWWSHLGASADLLRQAHPKARCLAVEPEIAGRPAAEPLAAWWSPRRWRSRSERTLTEAEVPPAAAPLLWANMMLHAVDDPRQTMLEWHRALAVDGFLMFSTLGPGSLRGLRDLYRREGWPTPHAAFVDMHDLGDMLVRSGFADPVMDQESGHTHLGLGGGVARGTALPGRERRSSQDGRPSDATVARGCNFCSSKHGRCDRPCLDGVRDRLWARGAPAASTDLSAATTSIGLDDMRTMVRRRAQP